MLLASRVNRALKDRADKLAANAQADVTGDDADILALVGMVPQLTCGAGLGVKIKYPFTGPHKVDLPVFPQIWLNGDLVWCPVLGEKLTLAAYVHLLQADVDAHEKSKGKAVSILERQQGALNWSILNSAYPGVDAAALIISLRDPISLIEEYGSYKKGAGKAEFERPNLSLKGLRTLTSETAAADKKNAARG